MKTLLLMVLTIVVAHAGEKKSGKKADLTICLQPPPMTDSAFFVARETVNKLMAPAGIAVAWSKKDEECANASRAIMVKVLVTTPVDLFPGALAYAKPFKGTEMVVFLDRVVATAVSKDHIYPLLGHVLAHEIIHLLQGMARHSETGLMKARWDWSELALMKGKLIPLADKDIEFAQEGLVRWTTSLRAAIEDTQGR